MTDHETRKRLIIDRHIFKMGPEEIARRFTIAIKKTAATNAARHKAATR